MGDEYAREACRAQSSTQELELRPFPAIEQKQLAFTDKRGGRKMSIQSR
jgi:hypothetical protein